MSAALATGVSIWGLIAVGAVASVLVCVGFVVFLSDMTSATHRAFLALTGSSVVWSLFNYAIYQSSDPAVVLWLLRFIMFSAVWFALALFTFFYVFPERTKVLPPWYRYLVLPSAAAVSIVTLTPLVFSTVTSFSGSGQVEQVANGPGIILFGLVACMLDFGAIYIFIRKTLRVHGPEQKPYRLILIGMFTTILLIVTLNFLAPAFFRVSAFVPYGTLFLLPFVGMTAYAVREGKILNVKELSVALLVSALAIGTLSELIFTTDPVLILFRVSVFALVLLIGLMLIRGVVREVEQRERIEKLAAELQQTNERQETLIHFIGHEVKGFLTKAANTFSLLNDGELGAMPEAAKPFVGQALAETQKGVESVSEILKASNLKKGTITLKKEPFDLRAAVAELIERERPMAEGKKLAMAVSLADGEYPFIGDKGELTDHVFRNLVENAINYTPSGTIEVSLSKTDGKYVFAVKDSGVGITDEDKARLFTEGGHGKDSQKVNAHSTGYGLFIAKQVVTQSGGTISDSSEGAGKGSTFTVELPAA